MAFSFPLQALLNWKQSLEESSQIRLAEIMGRLRRAEEEIRNLTLLRLECDRKLKEKSQEGMEGGEYQMYQQFAEDSRRALLSLEGKRTKILREAEEERKKLIAITQEKKILEKLKEKQFKDYLLRREKAEQRQNDEMATMRYSPPSPQKTS